MTRGMTRKPGFTIIELMVVIVIIGLLSAAAASSFLRAQRNSRDSTRKTNVNSIAGAVESFYAVNRKFPGHINISTPGDGLPGGYSNPTAYNAIYKNCQLVDSSNAYVYYYYPLMPTGGSGANQVSCNDTSRSDNSIYSRADYTPFPTWIPGLGAYLNPFPIEKRFSNADGSTTNDFSRTADELQATDDINGNYTRTYIYRKLVGGYAVYTRLENTAGDVDALPAGTLNDQPTLPAAIQSIPLGRQGASSSAIYMVRK